MKKLLILTLCLVLLTGCGQKEEAANTYEIQVENTVMTVTFDEGTLSSGTIHDTENTYRFEYKMNGDLEITYPNGAKAAFNEEQGIGTGSVGGDISAYPGVISFAWALDDVYESKSEKAEGRGQIALGLLLIAIGCFMMFGTRTHFMLSHGWKYRNAEPSELYLTLTKMGGGVVAFIGILAIISAL